MGSSASRKAVAESTHVAKARGGKLSVREATDLFGEMVKAADTNKDGMIDKDELKKLLANPVIFKQASAAVEDKAKADAANDAYFATTQKIQPPGSVPWSRSLYDQVATRVAFLSSKLGREPYAVDSLADMLNRGAYELGVGNTKKALVKLGFDPKNLVLGADGVIHDSRLGMHNKSLHGGRCSTKPCSCYKCWLDVYAHYAGLTKFGVVILAGTLDLFQRWAKSEACREEVKLVAQGRLFAFVNGYLLALDLHNGQASASVSDCTTGGVIVWGSGAYYEGGLKGGLKHGQGTFTLANGSTYTGGFVDSKQHGHGTQTWADGITYTGGWVDGNMHGQGTFTWADGNTYTGDYVDDKRHGQGTLTFASDGFVQKGRFENDEFMG